MSHDRRLAKELVAAAMVRMEMGVHDHVDVVRREADAGQTGQQRFTRRHDRLYHPRQRAPARLRIVHHIGMAAGIEQHVALPVPDQGARDRQIDHFIAVCTGNVDALPHAQASGGKKIEFHVAVPRPWPQRCGSPFPRPPALQPPRHCQTVQIHRVRPPRLISLPLGHHRHRRATATVTSPPRHCEVVSLPGFASVSLLYYPSERDFQRSTWSLHQPRRSSRSLPAG
jgi:hypothetical protein